MVGSGAADVGGNARNESSGVVVFDDMRLGFLKILTEYEHFVPLNLTHSLHIKSISTLLQEFKYVTNSGSTLPIFYQSEDPGLLAETMTFRETHFLCAVVMEHISSYVDHPEKQIRTKVRTHAT